MKRYIKVSLVLKKFKNPLLTLLGNGTYSFFQWLVISIMTKYYGIIAVGDYSNYSAIITPIVTFANLSLRSMIITDVQNKYKRNDYLILRILSSIISIIVIFSIFIFNDYSMYSLTIATIIMLTKIFPMYSDMSYGYMIKWKKFEKYTFSLSVTSVTSFLLFYLTTILTKNLLVSLIFYLLPYIMICFFYDMKNIDFYYTVKNLEFQKDKIFTLVKLTLPLGLVQSLNTLYDTIPKLIISKYIGNAELGIYSAAAYISLIGGLFVSSVTLTYANGLAKRVSKKENKEFFKIIFIEIMFVILICTFIFCIFKIFGRQILTLLYTSDFVPYQDVVLVLICALAVNFIGNVVGTACTAARLNSEQLYVSIVALVTLFILNLIFVKNNGVLGASIALLITYLLKSFMLFMILIYSLIIKKKR